MSSRRDDDVVARAKAGDADAWRALYRSNANRLKAWLEAVPTSDAATDSEDIAASAWMTASRRIDSFQGSSSDFAGWLFTIARNIARTTSATGARRATFPADIARSDPAIWGVVDDIALQADEADLAFRLIRRLSPREADIVACIDVAGFDIATTATILGITEVAVRVGHHRGLGRLRDLIRDAASAEAAASAPLPVKSQPSPGMLS